MNAACWGCPINLTLEALGDRWSLIVIRDLMFGNRRHFRELLTRLEERRNRTSIAQTGARFTGRSLFAEILVARGTVKTDHLASSTA
jgi:hypothetical protein